MQENQVWSLGWKEPLEEGMATHSSILARRIHEQRSLAGFIVYGVTESDMTKSLSLHQGTQCFLPHPNLALNLVDSYCWYASGTVATMRTLRMMDLSFGLVLKSLSCDKEGRLWNKLLRFESRFLCLPVLHNLGYDRNTGNPVGKWILVQTFKRLFLYHKDFHSFGVALY